MSLNVSRGSFYWHFRDIEHFHLQLLARWRERETDTVIQSVELESSPDARIRRLVRLGMAGENSLERGIRSGATQSAMASEAVTAVDKARIAYLTQLLKSAGVLIGQASARAAFI